ncbi:hypothetical protein OS42_24530 [Dickeya oryzae]
MKQNALQVEASARTCLQLLEQAEQLNLSVSLFHLPVMEDTPEEINAQRTTPVQVAKNYVALPQHSPAL